MKKLSEYKDEEALEVLADLLDPVCAILADKDVQKSVNGPKIVIAQVCLKKHPKEIRQIMATLDGVPLEEYHVGLFDPLVKILQILNDEDLVNFFRSQGQMISSNASGSVMENTQEKEPQEDSSAM